MCYSARIEVRPAEGATASLQSISCTGAGQERAPSLPRTSCIATRLHRPAEQLLRSGSSRGTARNVSLPAPTTRSSRLHCLLLGSGSS